VLAGNGILCFMDGKQQADQCVVPPSQISYCAIDNSGAGKRYTVADQCSIQTNFILIKGTVSRKHWRDKGIGR
jgi:hypothetical protein